MLDSSQTKARQNKKFLELHALYRMGHHYAHQNHNLMYDESDENCKNLFLLWLQRPVMPMHNVCYSVLSTTLPPFVRRFHFFDHTTYKTKKRQSLQVVNSRTDVTEKELRVEIAKHDRQQYG